MTTPLVTGDLIPSKAPNLQMAPAEYRREEIDNMNRVLRLYFNTLDNINRESINDIDFLNVNSQGEKLYKYYNCGGF